MIAAQGILTSRGGKTTHAAVVARGMGKTCVCGAEELDVDTKRAPVDRAGRHGGRRGRRHLDRRHERARCTSARCRWCAPPVVEYFEGDPGRGRRRGGRSRPGRAPHHDARRRGAAAAGPRQRRHRRGRRPGAPVRAPGDRPVPHRAHVPRRPAPARRAADPRRGPTSSASRRWTPCCRCSAGTSSQILERDGRAAGHDPADRPAAARVPARPHRAVGPGRAGRGARARRTRTTCDCCRPCTRCTSRTRCSACAASGSAWSSPACSPCRCGRSPRPPPS